MLDLHILPALGDYFTDVIMPADVLKWRDAQDAKPGTVNTRLRVLRTLLADAASDLEYIDNQPGDGDGPTADQERIGANLVDDAGNGLDRSRRDLGAVDQEHDTCSSRSVHPAICGAQQPWQGARALLLQQRNHAIPATHCPWMLRAVAWFRARGGRFGGTISSAPAVD